MEVKLELKKIKKVKFFSNFVMIKDLENEVNNFLRQEGDGIEILSVHPIIGMVAVFYTELTPV